MNGESTTATDERRGKGLKEKLLQTENAITNI
jgi:hypothetical protein